MSVLDIVACILMVLTFTVLAVAVIVVADSFKPENLKKYQKAYSEKSEKS